MDGNDLVRAIAKRTNFTITDTRTFYYAFISVLADCISNLTPIDARGFFHVDYTKVKARKGNLQADVIARKQDPTIEIRKVEFPETWRIRIKLSKDLKDILRQGEDAEEKEKEEEI